MRIVDENFYVEILEQIKDRQRWTRHRMRLQLDMLINDSFYKAKNDNYGDVFFEKTVSFTAQKSDPNESRRMSIYYIVGMNFKKIN